MVKVQIIKAMRLVRNDSMCTIWAGGGVIWTENFKSWPPWHKNCLERFWRKLIRLDLEMNLHKFKQRKKNNIKTVELDLMKMTDSSENYQAFFISGDDKLTIIIIGSWVACVFQAVIVPKRLLKHEKHKSGSSWYLSATLAFPILSHFTSASIMWWTHAKHESIIVS